MHLSKCYDEEEEEEKEGKEEEKVEEEEKKEKKEQEEEKVEKKEQEEDKEEKKEQKKEQEEKEDDDEDDDDDAPTTTGIISVFICHILVISISRSLYLMIFGKPFGSAFMRGHTLAQRLTLDPEGPISPRSPSLPIFPYKINSLLIRRHLLVLAPVFQ